MNRIWVLILIFSVILFFFVSWLFSSSLAFGELLIIGLVVIILVFLIYAKLLSRFIDTNSTEKDIQNEIDAIDEQLKDKN